MTKHIWKALTPDTAMNAVESVIQEQLSNYCVPRNSYINRVYEMETHSHERIIVKFYRPFRWTHEMILGEHAFLQKCVSIELPVIPPRKYQDRTLFTFDSIPFAIFPKKGGRSIDELNQELWKEVGRLLGRIHNVGNTISKTERIIWKPSIATETHLNVLKDCRHIPEDYKPIFEKTVSTFIQKADPLFSSIDTFLIHGDCHFGNIIHRPGESLYLVDFDDCVIGPPVQDMWMLLPDAEENCKKELSWFKEGYTTFRPFPESSLNLIPALRIMRQIHFAQWCAIQSNDPQFKHHFPNWGTMTYWNEMIKDMMGFNI
ncbi:MAG: serine/threonine protein kinase [Candidatus Margulisbacteria bacterium]|nr:serine/threonine protein kinase [Candidatus Margulisiibacteriota bacterium]